MIDWNSLVSLGNSLGLILIVIYLRRKFKQEAGVVDAKLEIADDIKLYRQYSSDLDWILSKEAFRAIDMIKDYWKTIPDVGNKVKCHRLLEKLKSQGFLISKQGSKNVFMPSEKLQWLVTLVTSNHNKSPQSMLKHGKA